MAPDGAELSRYLALRRFRGGLRAWDQGIWSEGIFGQIAKRVAIPVNFDRIANGCSEMMERHRRNQFCRMADVDKKFILMSQSVPRCRMTIVKELKSRA